MDIGRTPALDKEKAREGGRGIVVDPMAPREIAALAAPSFLRKAGREVWFAALATLGAARHLSRGDLPTLVQGCLDYQRWQEFEEEIARRNRAGLRAEGEASAFAGELDATPNGFRQMSQLRILADRAKKDWQTVARQFGLTPVARVRTAGAAQGDFFAALDTRDGGAERDAMAGAFTDPADPFAPAMRAH